MFRLAALSTEHAEQQTELSTKWHPIVDIRCRVEQDPTGRGRETAAVELCSRLSPGIIVRLMQHYGLFSWSSTTTSR